MQESMLQFLLSMVKRRGIWFREESGYIRRGVVNGIVAEDGSGTSFNVTVLFPDAGGDMIQVAARDEVHLDPNTAQIDSLSDEQVVELIRCGVCCHGHVLSLWAY